MPWSPVPKMPAIMKDLYERGYIEQPFSYEVLEVSIIKLTGLVKQVSISRQPK